MSGQLHSPATIPPGIKPPFLSASRDASEDTVSDLVGFVRPKNINDFKVFGILSSSDIVRPLRI